MKKIKTWLIFCSILSINACSEESNSQSNSHSNNSKTEVIKAIKDLNNALIDPQNIIFENLVSERLSYGHSSGKIQNKKQFIDDLINGSFKFNEIDILDQTIDIVKETAIVRHVFSAKATNAGDSIKLKIGIILIYQIENDKWKLLARQAYKL